MKKIKITSQRQQAIVKAVEACGKFYLGEFMSNNWKAAHVLLKNNPEKFICRIDAETDKFYYIIIFKKEV